jgi:succinate dehydrogenase / fumarate reductase flavoprotein subunit
VEGYVEFWEYTADGMALPTKRERTAGMNSQFHPTGMVWPPGARNPATAVRGEGGTPKNNRGERFMEKYDSSAWNFQRGTLSFVLSH